MWPELQDQLAKRLMRPGPAPIGVLGGVTDKAVQRRFDVYRNNMMVNLTTSLWSIFPVIATLVGEDCFRELTRLYVRAEPPSSPVVIGYGESLADFLTTLKIDRDVPFLADIARLEWARNEAYHAADADPVDISELAGTADGDLDGVCLSVHPSVRLIRSNWPIVSIWYAHQQSDVASALANVPRRGEAAVVLRPHLDVEVRTISDEAFAMLAALAAGLPLGNAISAAAAAGPRDLSACLEGVFSLGTIVSVGRSSSG